MWWDSPQPAASASWIGNTRFGSRGAAGTAGDAVVGCAVVVGAAVVVAAVVELDPDVVVGASWVVLVSAGGALASEVGNVDACSTDVAGAVSVVTLTDSTAQAPIAREPVSRSPQIRSIRTGEAPTAPGRR